MRKRRRLYKLLYRRTSSDTRQLIGLLIRRRLPHKFIGTKRRPFVLTPGKFAKKVALLSAVRSAIRRTPLLATTRPASKDQGRANIVATLLRRKRASYKKAAHLFLKGKRLR